jgi:predicted small lipoprotein YifL
MSRGALLIYGKLSAVMNRHGPYLPLLRILALLSAAAGCGPGPLPAFANPPPDDAGSDAQHDASHTTHTDDDAGPSDR